MSTATSAARSCVAAGILVTAALGFAAPAVAGGDSVTIDNSTSLTIRSGQSLHVASYAGATCKHALVKKRSVAITLTGPTSGPSTQTLKTDRVPCDKAASLSASFGAPKRNGSYTVFLVNNSQSTARATLQVLIPPARATGFGVSTTGTTAHFTWAANSEPDIASYDVMSAGGSVLATVAPSGACGGGSSCGTSVDLGAKAAGRTEKFTVRALRCGDSCSSGLVAGSSSSPATATFPAAPKPSPTPTPTPTPADPGRGSGHGGGHGGGKPGGGSRTHHGGHTGTGAGSATSGTRGGHHAGTGAGTATSTPTPGADPTSTDGTGASLPVVHLPLPHSSGSAPTGSASPGAQSAPGPQVATSSPAVATGALGHSDPSGLTSAPLWRSIAAGAILLLLALHLRTWASRVDAD